MADNRKHADGFKLQALETNASMVLHFQGLHKIIFLKTVH